MDEVTDLGQFSEDSRVDLLVFGRRLRHLRRARGLTLRELGERVGKHPPYLSQLENGRREPSLSLVGALARVLGTSPSELLAPSPPTRRAELEIALERAQDDTLWQGELELPPLAVSAGTPTPVLEALVGLFDEVKRRVHMRAETPEGARRANVALREEMEGRDNYFPEIEAEAARALQAVGYRGEGPLSQRLLGDLARHLGFTLHPVRDLPGSVRSVTDLRHRRIYVGQRDRVASRLARPMVVQTLGHFVLGHRDPADFGEFLRQRVEANYFAGAVLVPAQATVPLLAEAKERRDLSVQDLEERFYVSYEMAAHRFTNLATHHLGIPLHFLRSDAEGVIWKAYETDGIPFPTDAQGAIEGQLLCRYWGPRRAFGSEHAFSVHYQYTDTPVGTFWDSTYVEVEREPHHAIGLGTRYEEARYFRGSDTRVRTTSRCPEGPCCRRPPTDLATRWDGRAWPSPRPHSHVLAALPAGTFPGVDLFEVYEFLEAHAPRGGRREGADAGPGGERPNG